MHPYQHSVVTPRPRDCRIIKSIDEIVSIIERTTESEAIATALLKRAATAGPAVCPSRIKLSTAAAHS
jgi:hypothetical protein